MVVTSAQRKAIVGLVIVFIIGVAKVFGVDVPVVPGF